MTQPYEQMTFVEKAIYHTRKAEEYQRQAEVLENWADANSGNPELAAELLADPYKNRQAFQYKQATGNRNGHQQRAIMYGIIALLERSFK
jgi:hypothetical protein